MNNWRRLRRLLLAGLLLAVAAAAARATPQGADVKKALDDDLALLRARARLAVLEQQRDLRAADARGKKEQRRHDDLAAALLRSRLFAPSREAWARALDDAGADVKSEEAKAENAW